MSVFGKCIQAGDNTKAEDLCRVFTEMAESFLEHIANTPGEGFGSLFSVQILLKCLETGSVPIAKIMLDFWFRLSEEVFRRKESIEYSSGKAHNVRFPTRLLHFRVIFGGCIFRWHGVSNDNTSKYVVLWLSHP